MLQRFSRSTFHLNPLGVSPAGAAACTPDKKPRCNWVPSPHLHLAPGYELSCSRLYLQSAVQTLINPPSTPPGWVRESCSRSPTRAGTPLQRRGTGFFCPGHPHLLGLLALVLRSWMLSPRQRWQDGWWLCHRGWGRVWKEHRGWGRV